MKAGDRRAGRSRTPGLGLGAGCSHILDLGPEMRRIEGGVNRRRPLGRDVDGGAVAIHSYPGRYYRRDCLRARVELHDALRVVPCAVGGARAGATIVGRINR